MVVLQGDEFQGFRIIRKLGGGAVGDVYLATDLRSFRHVALKILSEEGCSQPELSASFEREARIGQRIRHPHLAECLDACSTGERPWIAFEYVVGTSLAEMVQRNGPMEPALALHIGHEIALGLAAAHQRGLCHGDLKPANVMVTPSGSVKLIDFGAAHGDEAPDEGVRSIVPCTRAYAAPEQLQGKELDERADLYALGLLLYEILTGRRVLEPAPRPRMIFAQTSIPDGLAGPSLLRPCLPPELDELVFGLLAFRPEERRPRSAAEVAAHLEGMVELLERDSSHRREQRQSARRDLAETDFWKAQNLIDQGRIGEGLALWRSLVDLPSDGGRPYRDRIRESLSRLLLELPVPSRSDGLPILRRQALDQLIAVARVALALGDKDLLLRVERRGVSLIRDFKDADEALRCLTRLLQLVPWSHAVATAIFVTATEAQRPKTLAAIRLPLARICLACRDFRRAMALAMDEMHHGGRRDQASAILGAVASRKRDGEESASAFEAISSLFIARQHFAEGANVCRKHLRDHPWDEHAWERLADLCLALDEVDEGCQSLLTTARIAFTRGELPEARRLLVRLLRVAPEHEGAYAFLYEVLLASNALPEGTLPGRKLRLSIFCQEGIALAGAADLSRELFGTLDDVPLLEALIPIARQAGKGELESAVQLRLARFALDGGLREEARGYFVAALEASTEPVALLETIQKIELHPPIFSALEILRLRRRLVGEDTGSLRQTNRHREALERRLDRERALEQRLQAD